MSSNSSLPAPGFDKYRRLGAYHWAECERSYANYLRFNPPLVARYDFVLQEARRLRPLHRLLDLGCGDGVLLDRLSPLSTRVEGLDVDETGLTLAAQELAHRTNCRLCQGCGYQLPYRSGCFDLVVSADVIEHLVDPERHLREAARVLGPRGTLLLTTPKWTAHRKWDSNHVKEYRPRELRDLLQRHFSRIRMRFYWPLTWSRLYATRLGWRLIKLMSIHLYDPFRGRISSQPAPYGQILAICRKLP